MELSTITELVANMAFPIVCCIMLFWQMTKRDEAYNKVITDLTSAVNNNTKAIDLLKNELDNRKVD